MSRMCRALKKKKNCVGLGILLYVQSNKLACYFFTDAGSETKDLTTQGMEARMNFMSLCCTPHIPWAMMAPCIQRWLYCRRGILSYFLKNIFIY